MADSGYNLRPKSRTLHQIQNLSLSREKNGIRSRKNTAPEEELCGIRTKKSRLIKGSIPLPSCTSSDVALDVLQYFNRNEVERCQLLSYNFDQTITSSNLLPQYLVEEIVIDYQRGCTATISVPGRTKYINEVTKKSMDDKYVIASLANCYAKRVKIAIRDDEEKVLKKLEEIVKMSGKLIQTTYCEIIFCMGKYEWFKNIPIIFRDFISAEKFNLVLYTMPPLKFIAKNPSCLELFDPKVEINIETANCHGYNWKKVNCSLYRFIAGEGFEKMLNRESLELGHINGNQIDLLSSIVKILRSSDKLPYLFKRLRLFVQPRNRDDTTFHSLFLREGYRLFNSTYGRYQDKNREDGWVIEVDFNHAYMMEFAILSPGEERKGVGKV